MNINPNAGIQQAQTNNGETQKQYVARMMRATLASLPEHTQSEIKALMSELDPATKKEAATKMLQIESSNMTVADLTKAIMDIYKPGAATTPSKSSYPSAFSVYA
ncbi:hypothetical protein [Sulfurimonas sp.]|uniref:hypothetical protein n=1 Tax=Sulfurimonas sp. TaxID=2022749 RepID=UPI0025F51D4B|nr:hypothetical protein [Sulfurimonas sp.]